MKLGIREFFMKLDITEKIIAVSLAIAILVYLPHSIGFYSEIFGAIGGLSFIIFFGALYWKFHRGINHQIRLWIAAEQGRRAGRREAEAERQAHLRGIHEEAMAWGSGMQRGADAIRARERARKQAQRNAEAYRRHLTKLMS